MAGISQDTGRSRVTIPSRPREEEPRPKISLQENRLINTRPDIVLNSDSFLILIVFYRRRKKKKKIVFYPVSNLLTRAAEQLSVIFVNRIFRSGGYRHEFVKNLTLI